ncbi:MAG TPA: 3-dehydroquinate synthase [Anaerolineales bacterium]|nr:3-dehydroquinate synthase [Anaerolineales bacterium]HNQ96093.1 3-dehydroquinate synthase [Anaerolineales bacterium]HNS61878.1 3-dehydroquinate synthase [Anaerolineales bacterium]
MHIFLYGPPGSGKSTIGRIVSRNLKLPFIDLDRVIETNAGMSIPQIMAQQGESAFRDLESAALRECCSPLPLGEGLGRRAELVEAVRESVIALGGGALLREENRQLAESKGKVVLLSAELKTLLERLNKDLERRPLLAGDLKTKLANLLEKRREHYGSFALEIQTDNNPAKQNAHLVQVILGRHRLSAMGEYDVIVGQVANLSYGNLVVTDENVAKHHLKKFNIEKSIIIPAGEEHKNLETVSRLWKAFLENGLDRKSTIIALGGGVIGDLAGFAASTYMRGIDWIAVPTTLLAMVDASIGGKTGFDLPEGKNLIGSFHPPRLVLADPSLLRTLSDRDLRSGMAEVVKHGIIADPELFAWCSNGMDWVKNNLEDVVKRAMAVKIKIIEEDPYEKGIRAALNLGHTVGHAVELVSGFKLSHGESVSIGMVVEAKYAVSEGRAVQGSDEAIESTLSKLGLPTRIPDGVSHEAIIRAMRVDKKKNAKSIRFALPVEIGKVELVDVTNLEEVL